MYYLGVDAGGTKTTVAIVNDNADIVDAFKLGSGNVVSLGQAKTAELIKNILSRITANCKLENIASSTFAFAGAGRDAEKKILEAIIRDSRLSNFKIMTDAEIMHYSFFGSNSGILISAGTGSICIVKKENSEFCRLGGYGFLLGDEGGGFYIGREAIKKALDDAEINRPKTLLTKKILGFYKIQQPNEIISKTCDSDSPQKLIASCAETVCGLAEENEPNAAAIISNAAEALVNLAVKAITHHCPPNTEVYNIAAGGGILRQNSIVEKLFRQKLQMRNFKLNYFSQQMSPVAAAAMYSMSQAGLQINDSIMDKLKNIDREAN